MKQTKILIGIADNHKVFDKDFSLSLLQVVRHFDLWAAERKTDKHEFVLGITVASDGGVDDMRNSIVYRAQMDGFDYIFWMDSDQTFPADCLPKLLSYCERDGYEAASGLYTYKVPPFMPHVYPVLDETEGKFKTAFNFPLDKPFTIEGAAFGCLLMRTSVFVRMEKPYFTMSFEDGKIVKGEDLPFCAKAKMRMILDPTIACGHLKTTSFGILDFLNYNGIEVTDGWVKPTPEQSNAIIEKQRGLTK